MRHKARNGSEARRLHTTLLLSISLPSIHFTASRDWKDTWIHTSRRQGSFESSSFAVGGCDFSSHSCHPSSSSSTRLISLPHAFSPRATTQNNTNTQPLRLRLTAHRHHVGPSGLLRPAAIGSIHLSSLQPACRPPAAHQRAHLSRAIRHLAMALQPRDAP